MSDVAAGKGDLMSNCASNLCNFKRTFVNKATLFPVDVPVIIDTKMKIRCHHRYSGVERCYIEHRNSCIALALLFWCTNKDTEQDVSV